MTWKLTQKEIEAVSILSGEKRFSYFIKRVAAFEELWGLYNDGWALAGDDEGDQIFPLWPASEYAKPCAVNHWEGFSPRKIDLDYFLEDLLPRLEKDGVLLGVFFNSSGQGVVISVDDFLPYLQEELDKY